MDGGENKGGRVENRIDLARHFNELGFTLGAEIGVADGRYSEILCQQIPDLTLYCIDSWAKYENWRSQEYQDSAYQKAVRRLQEYGVSIIRATSVEAYINLEPLVEDESLDFVFIDGDHHFDQVMTDIILWTKRVKKGGIVSGHDYYHHRAGGVIPAVDAYVAQHNLKLNIIPEYRGGHQDDIAPCWWFVK